MFTILVFINLYIVSFYDHRHEMIIISRLYRVTISYDKGSRCQSLAVVYNYIYESMWMICMVYNWYLQRSLYIVHWSREQRIFIHWPYCFIMNHIILLILLISQSHFWCIYSHTSHYLLFGTYIVRDGCFRTNHSMY